MALVAVGVLAGVASGASAAQGGCGEVEEFKATHALEPGGRAPLAVGDSVMLLALQDLAGVGYDTNGQGCRSFADGLKVLRAERARGQLPHLVVLALGTDGTVSIGKVESALKILGPEAVLGLVTPRELGGNPGSDATAVRQAAAKYPTRIVLLDWVKYSTGHYNWFQPDHTHLSFAGAAAFARLLGDATRFSKPNHFPDRDWFPSDATAPPDSESGSPDSAQCFGMEATIIGTFGPDRLTGTPRRDVIVGLGGNDVIMGKGGNDVICAGASSDFIYGGPGDDSIAGGNNDDTLHAGPGNDILRGQRGADYLDGGQGSDLIVGGPDGGTTDTADIASFAGKTASVTVDLATGTATGQGDDTLIEVEGAMGSYLPDTIIGDENANSLTGSASPDTIIGAGGNDLIGGGPSDDTISGGEGDDQILGAAGNDTLYGGVGNDSLEGEEGSDRLYGEEGDDYLDGGSGPEGESQDYGDGGPQPVGDACRDLEEFIDCELLLPAASARLSGGRR